MADKLPLGEFAAKIKAKYPQYQSVNDTVLVEKMLAKYPEYSDKVDWPQKKSPNQNEVSGQDSASGVPISGEPLPTSQENDVIQDQRLTDVGSSLTDQPTFGDLANREGDNAISNIDAEQQEKEAFERRHTPDIEGTFREGWTGNWNYDGEGYENYQLPEEVFQSVFGGDATRAKEYFSKEMPNVLVHLPSGGEYTGQAEISGVGNIVNYDTAEANDLDQIEYERMLSSIDRETLTDESKAQYDLAVAMDNLVKNNLPRRSDPEQQRMDRAQQHGEALAESDDDRWGITKYIGTPVANLAEGMGREGTRLLANVMGIPEFVHDSLANGINQVISTLGGDPEFLHTWKEDWGESGNPIDAARDYMYKAVDRGLAKNESRYGDLGIYESLQDGNYDAAANKLADGLGSMIPFTAMLMLTRGRGSMLLGTGSVAAGQYEDLQESDLSQPTKLLNALINGASETGFERLGNKILLEPLERAVKNFGKERGAQIAQSTLEKSLRKTLGRFYPLAPATIEVTTELATEITNNITARVTGEDPDRKWSEGLEDVAIISAVYGGGSQAMTSAVQSINKSQSLTSALKLNKENAEIETALNDPELTQEERIGLSNKYQDNLEQINGYIIEEQEKKQRLNGQQRALVEDLEVRKARIAPLLESDRVPDSVKESSQEEINEINDQIEEIMGDAPVDAETPLEKTEIIESQPDADIAPNEFKDVRETISQEGVEVSPETLAGKSTDTVWYHGSGKDLSGSSIDSAGYSRPDGLLGLGFYMTDDPSVAQKYSRLGRNKKGSTINQIDVKVDRVLDAEKPIDNDVAELYKSNFSYIFDLPQDAAIFFDEVKSNNPNASMLDYHKALYDYIAENEIPTNDVHEAFQDLEAKLKDSLGYDAISHVGGANTNSHKHNVLILLDPSSEYSNPKRIVNNIKKYTPTIEATPTETEAAPIDEAVQPAEPDVAQDTQPEIVSEESSTEGQYFTRDIGGEQTVYRRNEDGTASIVPDAEAQQVLAQQAEAPPVSEQATQATEDTATNSTKKSDIERRRQEEINELSRFPIKTATEEYNRVESPDGLAAVSKNLLDEINAKYDAELAALERTQSKEQPPSSQEETEAAAATPAALAPDTQTVSMPVSQITTDESSFQNREGLDQSRVDDIVENFDEVKLDPIVVYNDDGKTVVLSGHHRLAAAQQMGMENIPTKIFKGTKEEAIEFARDSNTLSRAETATERAGRYRDMRARGDSEATIKEKARIAHGPEATKVINLSHLSESGKALEAINSFSKSTDVDTKNKVEAIGDWIGNVKSKHPDLSTRQENEMFDYLMEKYGTKRKSGIVSSRAQFFDVANALIERAKSKGSFNEDTVLNLNNAAGKTGIELEYDRVLQEAKDAVQDARTALDNARKRAVSDGIPSERMTSLLAPLENNLRGALAEESAVRELKGAVNESVKAQTSIFDTIQENETEISNTPAVEQRVDDAFKSEQTTDTETTGGTQGTERAKPKQVKSSQQKGEPQGQVDEVTETAKPKAPAKKPAEKPKKGAPSIKEMLSSPEARQARMEELRARIANRPPQGLGIARDSKAEASYWRDVTDYAMIRIVDGAITTAKQLAQELGINNTKQLRDAFDYAKAFVEADNELATTTARNVDTAAKREAYGFDDRAPIVREIQSDVVAEAKRQLESGYDVMGLIHKIRGGLNIAANSLETAILAQYAASNEAEMIRQMNEMERTRNSSLHTFNQHSEAKDRARDNLLWAYEALEMSGTANARALAIRKQAVERDFSLASMIADRRKAIGSDYISPEQMAEVEAKFKEVMEISDKIKARNEELLSENARLDVENRMLKLKQDTAESRRKASKKPRTEKIPDIRERRKAAVADVAAVWAEWTSPGFAQLPENQAKSDAKLAKGLLTIAQTYIEEGVVDAMEIVDKMYNQLKDALPGITKEQLMNAIAGSEPDRRPTLNDMRQQMRDFRAEIRLLNQIQAAERGVKSARPGRQSVVRNARLQDLRSQLREIQEANEDSEIKRERDLSKAKKNINTRMKELQRRIRDKDYSKPDRDLLQEDGELKKMRTEYRKLLFNYRLDNYKYELERRSKGRKFLDAAINIAGVPRAIMATADVSAVLRQGIFVAASRPMMTAKNAVEMFKFWNSKDHYDNFMDQFRGSPGHDLAIKSGLSISDQASNVQAAAREEDFMSNLVNKIPLFGETLNPRFRAGGRQFQVGDLHGRSERAYVGFLNKMRIDMFERGAELLLNDGINPTDNPSAYQKLAKYVNAATGRGPMFDSLKTAGAALSTTFFAPRLISSRLYLLGGGPLWEAPAAVRKMYIRDLVTFVSFGVGVLSLFSLMGADVEDDPRSADFGKIRFGDDRYDIWGGFTQYITFLARMMPSTIMGVETGLGGRKTSTGKIRKLDGTEFDRMTRLDVLSRFARSKAAPTTALAISALDGKNYMGEPFDLGQELLNMSAPLVLQDIAEAVGDKPAWQLGLSGAAMMFGVGFQSYAANNFLERGVDNELIDLLNDKKAATMEPEQQRVRVYDLETGKDEGLNGEQFKRYTRIWSDYIKKELEDRKDELSKLSEDAFDTQFTGIKRAATEYAKKELSGVSSYDLRIESGGNKYKLTKEQVDTRLGLMEQFKKDNAGLKYDLRDKYLDQGMTNERALIEAQKDLDSRARSYSRNVMLEMNEYGEIDLSEGN